MPWQCVALVLQRLHRGSLQLAAAAPLQPFLMMVKSLTSRICGSDGYYISFEPVPPELRWLFVSAMQAIFFSSAASRPYFISALHLAQRRVDRELPGGIEQAPLGKKKLFCTGENKYVLIQRCFRLEQNSHSTVWSRMCLCVFPGQRRGITQPNSPPAVS